MTAKIDTLTIYERLKSAELNDKAAREIAEVIKEFAYDHLATKEVLDRLKADFIKWVAGMLAAQAAIVSALVKLL